MARIVLGIGTSHSFSLSTPPQFWSEYEKTDRRRTWDLVYPPDGICVPYDEAIETIVPKEIRDRPRDEATFREQHTRINAAIDALRDTLAVVKPDVTVIISDDQDEWFFENNMPCFSIYWGESAKLLPRVAPPDNEAMRIASRSYGTKELEVPVASTLGRHVIDHLMDHHFDVGHMTYLQEQYGGRVVRRYPTRDGESNAAVETKPRPLGLPHGYSFIVARLMSENPSPILPVFQNTCYPPNQVRPDRAYDFGKAIGDAIGTWDEGARVAVVASGGLSHFVTDEELDQTLIDGLLKKDAQALRGLPRHRLYSAASESLNWVAAGGALSETDLNAELLDYVPVYRTPAGTGGGWTFMRWQ